MATVIAIKVTNGEEWIGKYTPTIQGNEVITLDDPRRLMLTRTQKGEGLMLAPIFMSDVDLKTVSVPKEQIIATIQVSASFEKEYLQEVSGIQLM
jgi:hypothetical protein